MRKTRLICMTTLLLSLLTALQSCSSGDEGITVEDDWAAVGLTLTRDASKRDKATVIGQFERNGVRLRVIDITRRFTEAVYCQRSVPVSYVPMEQLPETIKEKVYQWGMSSLTKLFRLEYKGKTYYDMTNPLSSSLFNIYDSEGNPFVSYDDYEEIQNEANISCILVLDTEIIKNADDAPNYLVGIWQNDWQHLIQGSEREPAIVTLYPDLPFSITEVMRFRDDGTGYLRTIKEYKDGQKDITLDPFNYELTDYHGGDSYGYHAYSYLCHFEAGDDIEFCNNMNVSKQVMVPYNAWVNYPWFRQTKDDYESQEVNCGMKYGTPAADNKSPIVGRWSGQANELMGKSASTWVFRSDNTGYLLVGQQFSEPFVYTVDYQGSEAELTIYKYNTGFFVSDGFAEDIVYTDFEPTILPQGKTMKATFKDGTLELEGWETIYQREG